jgi:hypothetical protein
MSPVAATPIARRANAPEAQKSLTDFGATRCPLTFDARDSNREAEVPVSGLCGLQVASTMESDERGHSNSFA